MKDYFIMHSVPSAAFYVGLPGRSLADIRNAIAVYEEARKYIDTHSPKFAGLTAGAVRTALAGYFRSSPNLVQPKLAAGHRPKYDWRYVLGVASILGRVCAWLAILLPLARIHEAIERRRPKPQDWTFHEAMYDNLDVGPQNHLCTLATIRPGRFRAFAIKTVLRLANEAATKVFVFGKLNRIPTIHFARWVLIDHGQRVLFLSNYDGSWASYLGDFRDQAIGLNAIWANTVGFVPTRWLVFGGAHDLGPYQDAVRRHFQPALVFYKAYEKYPVLNIQQYLKFRDELAGAIQREAAAKGKGKDQ